MVSRLDDFVDRALTPSELELVEEHLLECAECAREFRFETSLMDSLRERLGRIAVPETLLQRIRKRLDSA
jgi:anti-sigma factor RsiW